MAKKKVKTKKKVTKKKVVKKKATKKKGGKNAKVKKKKLKVVHTINGEPVATQEGNVEDFEITTSDEVPEFNENENQTGEFDDDTEEGPQDDIDHFEDPINEPYNDEPI